MKGSKIIICNYVKMAMVFVYSQITEVNLVYWDAFLWSLRTGNQDHFHVPKGTGEIWHKDWLEERANLYVFECVYECGAYLLKKKKKDSGHLWL